MVLRGGRGGARLGSQTLPAAQPRPRPPPTLTPGHLRVEVHVLLRVELVLGLALQETDQLFDAVLQADGGQWQEPSCLGPGQVRADHLARGPNSTRSKTQLLPPCWTSPRPAQLAGGLPSFQALGGNAFGLMYWFSFSCKVWVLLHSASPCSASGPAPGADLPNSALAPASCPDLTELRGDENWVGQVLLCPPGKRHDLCVRVRVLPLGQLMPRR